MRPPDPRTLLRVCIVAMLTAMLLSGMLMVFFQLDLTEVLPKRSICPFRGITGCRCPGCGMTRAMLLLGQLKVLRALKTNLLSFPLLILALMVLFRIPIPTFLSRSPIPVIILGLVILYGILRNLW